MTDYDPRDSNSNSRHDENNRSARRPPREEHSASPLYYGLFLILGIIIGGAVLWGITTLPGKFGGEKLGLDPSAQMRTATPTAPLDADEQESVTLFDHVKDSVVNVDVVMVQQGRWDEQPTETQTSGGSGFIWDTHGRIVTNYHVVASVLKRTGLELRVVLADRSAYSAKLLGASADNDLAVVQISAPKDKLKPIVVGTSHDLKVGQRVYAIGNPFGLSLSMTRGIISSLNRIIESPSGAKIADVIQTDAAINPGNSGGPLLDKSGRLIGVNTSIATASSGGGNIGIGFAIPVDTVNRIATELIQNGRSLSPDLGVKLYDERRLRQARYDHGVMVDHVMSDRAAAKAGLQGVRYNARGVPVEAGDLIIAIDGQSIDNVEDYERIVRGLRVGESAKLTIIRGTKEMEVTVVVDGV